MPARATRLHGSLLEESSDAPGGAERDADDLEERDDHEDSDLEETIPVVLIPTIEPELQRSCGAGLTLRPRTVQAPETRLVLPPDANASTYKDLARAALRPSDFSMEVRVPPN